jgi:hypothetical protein
MLDNCTHNVTGDQYCMVNFSDYAGDFYYANKSCEEFNQIGANDTDNYTYTYNVTVPDNETDTDWSCWTYDYASWAPAYIESAI